MLRRARSTLILLVLITAPASLNAQAPVSGTSSCGTDSDIAFARIAMRRLCDLLQDTTIQQATGAKDAVALIGLMPPDIMWRIEDRQLTTFFLTYARSLGSAEVETCAGALPRPGSHPWPERFMAIAMSVDTTDAAGWADFLEAWVYAYVGHAPLQPEASAQEVSAYLRRYLATLPPADRANYVRIGQGKAVAAPDACRLARMTFTWLGSLPPTRAGAVGRALMRGQRPWLPAA